MMIRLVILMVVGFIAAADAQTHFRSVAPTGLPYSVIVTGVKVNGSTIAAGSEIGIFQDTLCVGASVFDGTFNLQIIVWKSDSAHGLKGYQTGKQMTFRFWGQVQAPPREINMTPLFETGDGTFDSGLFSVVSLSALVTSIQEKRNGKDTGLNGILLQAYPNPTNGSVRVHLRTLQSGSYSMNIFSSLGAKIFSSSVNLGSEGESTVVWNCIDDQGRPIASGPYYIRIDGNVYHASMAMMYIK